MKILGLLLRNFGKFQNQKLRFESGINIIFGENESGKSTIHTFIKGMLFGIGRGRGRASVYDTYSIYEPWENPGYYSGILRFGRHSGLTGILINRIKKQSWSVRMTVKT